METNSHFATNVYYDRTFDCDAAKILPGEYYYTGKDMLIVTVLGSCVSACIRDRITGLGGMNHFMLPDGDSADASGRYGSYAMELLINEMLKLGARRESLQAKIFGGGQVMHNFTTMNVGERNTAFVTQYLQTERIPIVSEDVLDIYPRKVYFFPKTGKVLVKKLMQTQNDTLAKRELDYAKRLKVEPVGGDIDLF